VTSDFDQSGGRPGQHILLSSPWRRRPPWIPTGAMSGPLQSAWAAVVQTGITGGRKVPLPSGPDGAGPESGARSAVAFQGRHFVTWVVAIGRVASRVEGERLGEALRGRDVIRPVSAKERRHFHDDSGEWVCRSGWDGPLFSVPALVNSPNYVMAAHFHKQGAYYINPRYLVLDRTLARLYIFTDHVSNDCRRWVDLVEQTPRVWYIAPPDRVLGATATATVGPAAALPKRGVAPSGPSASWVPVHGGSVASPGGDAADALAEDDTDTESEGGPGSLSSLSRPAGRGVDATSPAPTPSLSSSLMSAPAFMLSTMLGTSSSSGLTGASGVPAVGAGGSGAADRTAPAASTAGTGPSDGGADSERRYGFMLTYGATRLVLYTQSQRRAKVWTRALRDTLSHRMGSRTQSHHQLTMRHTGPWRDAAVQAPSSTAPPTSSPAAPTPIPRPTAAGASATVRMGVATSAPSTSGGGGEVGGGEEVFMREWKRRGPTSGGGASGVGDTSSRGTGGGGRGNHEDVHSSRDGPGTARSTVDVQHAPPLSPSRGASLLSSSSAAPSPPARAAPAPLPNPPVGLLSTPSRAVMAVTSVTDLLAAPDAYVAALMEASHVVVHVPVAVAAPTAPVLSPTAAAANLPPSVSGHGAIYTPGGASVAPGVMVDTYSKALELYIKTVCAGNVDMLRPALLLRPARLVTDLGIFTPAHQFHLLTRIAALLPVCSEEVEALSTYHEKALQSERRYQRRVEAAIARMAAAAAEGARSPDRASPSHEGWHGGVATAGGRRESRISLASGSGGTGETEPTVVVGGKKAPALPRGQGAVGPHAHTAPTAAGGGGETVGVTTSAAAPGRASPPAPSSRSSLFAGGGGSGGSGGGARSGEAEEMTLPAAASRAAAIAAGTGEAADGDGAPIASDTAGHGGGALASDAVVTARPSLADALEAAAGLALPTGLIAVADGHPSPAHSHHTGTGSDRRHSRGGSHSTGHADGSGGGGGGSGGITSALPPYVPPPPFRLDVHLPLPRSHLSGQAPPTSAPTPAGAAVPATVVQMLSLPPLASSGSGVQGSSALMASAGHAGGLPTLNSITFVEPPDPIAVAMRALRRAARRNVRAMRSFAAAQGWRHRSWQTMGAQDVGDHPLTVSHTGLAAGYDDEEGEGDVDDGAEDEEEVEGGGGEDGTHGHHHPATGAAPRRGRQAVATDVQIHAHAAAGAGTAHLRLAQRVSAFNGFAIDLKPSQGGGQVPSSLTFAGVRRSQRGVPEALQSLVHLTERAGLSDTVGLPPQLPWTNARVLMQLANTQAFAAYTAAQQQAEEAALQAATATLPQEPSSVGDGHHLLYARGQTGAAAAVAPAAAGGDGGLTSPPPKPPAGARQSTPTLAPSPAVVAGVHHNRVSSGGSVTDPSDARDRASTGLSAVGAGAAAGGASAGPTKQAQSRLRYGAPAGGAAAGSVVMGSPPLGRKPSGFSSTELGITPPTSSRRGYSHSFASSASASHRDSVVDLHDGTLGATPLPSPAVGPGRRATGVPSPSRAHPPSIAENEEDASELGLFSWLSGSTGATDGRAAAATRLSASSGSGRGSRKHSQRSSAVAAAAPSPSPSPAPAPAPAAEGWFSGWWGSGERPPEPPTRGTAPRVTQGASTGRAASAATTPRGPAATTRASRRAHEGTYSDPESDGEGGVEIGAPQSRRSSERPPSPSGTSVVSAVTGASGGPSGHTHQGSVVSGGSSALLHGHSLSAPAVSAHRRGFRGAGGAAGRSTPTRSVSLSSGAGGGSADVDAAAPPLVRVPSHLLSPSLPAHVVAIIQEAHARGAVHFAFPDPLPSPLPLAVLGPNVYLTDVPQDTLAAWALDLARTSATMHAALRAAAVTAAKIALPAPPTVAGGGGSLTPAASIARHGSVTWTAATGAELDSALTWWSAQGGQAGAVKAARDEAPALQPPSSAPTPSTIIKVMEVVVARWKAACVGQAVATLLAGRHPVSHLLQRLLSNLQAVYSPAALHRHGVHAPEAGPMLKTDLLAVLDRVAGLIKEWPKAWTNQLAMYGGSCTYLKPTPAFTTAFTSPASAPDLEPGDEDHGSPALSLWPPHLHRSPWSLWATSLFDNRNTRPAATAGEANAGLAQAWRYVARLSRSMTLGERDCEEVARDAVHAVAYGVLSITVGNVFRATHERSDLSLKRSYNLLWGITSRQLGVPAQYALDAARDVVPIVNAYFLSSTFLTAAAQLRMPLPQLHTAMLADLTASTAGAAGPGMSGAASAAPSPRTSITSSIVTAVPHMPSPPLDGGGRAGFGPGAAPAPFAFLATVGRSASTMGHATATLAPPAASSVPGVRGGVPAFPQYGAGTPDLPAAFSHFQPAIDMLQLLPYAAGPYQKLRVIVAVVETLCKAITHFRVGLLGAMLRSPSGGDAGSGGAVSGVGSTPDSLLEPGTINADDLLSLVSFVVAHAGVPNILSQLEFVYEHISDDARLDKAGFYLTTLQAGALHCAVDTAAHGMACGNCEPPAVEGSGHAPHAAPVTVRCKSCGRLLCPECDAAIHAALASTPGAPKHLRVPAPILFYNAVVQHRHGGAAAAAALAAAAPAPVRQGSAAAELQDGGRNSLQQEAAPMQATRPASLRLGRERALSEATRPATAIVDGEPRSGGLGGGGGDMLTRGVGSMTPGPVPATGSSQLTSSAILARRAAAPLAPLLATGAGSSPSQGGGLYTRRLDGRRVRTMASQAPPAPAPASATAALTATSAGISRSRTSPFAAHDVPPALGASRVSAVPPAVAGTAVTTAIPLTATPPSLRSLRASSRAMSDPSRTEDDVRALAAAMLQHSPFTPTPSMVTAAADLLSHATSGTPQAPRSDTSGSQHAAAWSAGGGSTPASRGVSPLPSITSVLASMAQASAAGELTGTPRLMSFADEADFDEAERLAAAAMALEERASGSPHRRVGSGGAGDGRQALVRSHSRYTIRSRLVSVSSRRSSGVHGSVPDPDAGDVDDARTGTGTAVGTEDASSVTSATTGSGGSDSDDDSAASGASSDSDGESPAAGASDAAGVVGRGAGGVGLPVDGDVGHWPPFPAEGM